MIEELWEVTEGGVFRASFYKDDKNNKDDLGTWNRCRGPMSGIDSWEDYDKVLGKDVFRTEIEALKQYVANLSERRNQYTQRIDKSLARILLLENK